MKTFLICSLVFFLGFTVSIPQNWRFWPQPPIPTWSEFSPKNDFLENLRNPWVNRLEQSPSIINFQNSEDGSTGSKESNDNSQTTTTTSIPSTTGTIHLTPEGCNCPSTPQFNPVCGSDGNTYKNAGLLKCFRQCGIDVSQRRMGTC